MSTNKSIFISYRRDDSKWPSDAIYRALVAEFGRDAVFKDDDSIPDGVDFRKYIDEAVGKCDYLLAVIGTGWLDVRDKQGRRRLDNPVDFVRLEIEAALRGDIRVTPVLLDGAIIPDETELPETIRELIYRHARKVNAGPDFDGDIAKLIKGIRTHFDNLEQSAPPKSLKPEDEFANLYRYTTLKDHLANGRWKDADEETFRVMLKVAERIEKGWLDPPSIRQFPCEDLRIIDQLWVKFSDGRFGFSVQKRIYIETGNKPDGKYSEKELKKFGDRIGWRVQDNWLSYHKLTFDTFAPAGHLPAASAYDGFIKIEKLGLDWEMFHVDGDIGGVERALLSRVETCKL